MHINQLFIAFVTGLTTGGLGCVAMQGGLLASCLAPKQSLLQTRWPKESQRGTAQSREPRQAATPILQFMAAKLVTHTLLGLLLGALGSMLQLTVSARAVLMVAIGVFMVGNGLRMLDVHPIFRYFVLEPPAGIRRLVRRRAKEGADAITPLILGSLTVLIPCGVTQAMMALAIATGSALQGAGLMAAFTLGSSIVFFTVAYLATQLGTMLETNLARVVGIVLLGLGLFSVNSGLNLMGAPISLARLNWPTGTPAMTAAQPASPSVEGTNGGNEENELEITVSADGYVPSQLHARAGVPTRLTFVTEDVFSCALGLVIPELGVEQLLPVTGEVTVEIPPQPAGKVLRYSCSMGCNSAQIVFDG